MTDRKRTADMTPQERRERRSWKAHVIGFVSPRLHGGQLRGHVTPCDLNIRGGKEALQKLRRMKNPPPVRASAILKFASIHAARRERNRQRALAKENV